nr:type IIL restriction-modification enzyme MmeI [Limosilactobacillus avistercoris]
MAIIESSKMDKAISNLLSRQNYLVTQANDKAVLKAYGLKPSATEPEIVQHLFKMYEQLTSSK